jgi:protein-tyrosine phosphatase
MGFDATLHDLQRRGHRIVLAHVERCPAFQRKPEQLERLLAQGMLASVTAASLTGGFGRTVKAFAQQLMASGQVHNVSSDGHEAAGYRAPILMPLLVEAGYGSQAEWLARDVPHAVLAGAQLPSPPPFEPDAPRGLFGRLGRRPKA